MSLLAMEPSNDNLAPADNVIALRITLVSQALITAAADGL